MRYWLLVFVCLFAVSAQAQEEAAPEEPPKPWQHDVVGTLALTQVALKDWSQGGAEALSWSVAIDGESVNDVPRTNWKTTYKFAFGQAKLEEEGVRKTDDKIDLETLLTYKLGVYVNPYVAASLKTQFAKGFEYPEDGPRVQRSQFFDPAYLMQSAGVGYEPIPEIKTRLGLALRETVTRDFNHFSDDPDTADIEKTNIEGGLESVTEVKWRLQDNILFTTKLELFSAFSNFTDAVVRSDSNLAIKVSKYINVNVNTQVISDTSAFPEVQVKETVTLGLSYTLL